jgi:hypothetical protein
MYSDTGLRLVSIFRNANWKSGIWTNGLYIITDYGKVVFGIMEYLMVNGLAKIVKITLKYFNI